MYIDNEKNGLHIEFDDTNPIRLDFVARTIGLFWFDRIVVTAFGVSKIVIEVTTTGVLGFLVVNFTTAADLRARIVDLVTTVYRKSKKIVEENGMYK